MRRFTSIGVLLVLSCSSESPKARTDAGAVDSTSTSSAGPDLVLRDTGVALLPDGALADTAEAVCRGSCDYLRRCILPRTTSGGDAGTDDALAACMTRCAGSSSSSSLFKAGVMSEMATCFTNLPCSTRDDVCMEQAITTRNPSYLSDLDVQACLAKHASCDDQGLTGFTDDYCVMFPLFSAQGISAINACVAKPCADIQPCIDGLFGK